MRASHAGSFAALVLVAAVIVPAPGRAEEDMRAKGARLCHGDARRLCHDVLRDGDGAVLSCFQQNAARLSGGCRKFLADMGQL